MKTKLIIEREGLSVYLNDNLIDEITATSIETIVKDNARLKADLVYKTEMINQLLKKTRY